MLRSRQPLETSSSRFDVACSMMIESVVPLSLVFLSADTPKIAPVSRCKVLQPRGCGRPGSEESHPDMLRFVIGRISFEVREEYGIL